jgi:prepilin-type N-terminal cleavage/methylation domain-containing protein
MNISNHCPLAQRRQAFTLIELLMVISIIAVLSSLVVGLLLSARDDASAARTRSIITRCQAVLNARLENYEARNMPFRYEDLGVTSIAEKKRYYDNTILEWILVEMPSQLTDLTAAFPKKDNPNNPPNTGPPLPPDANYQAALTQRLTAMHQANLDYVARYGGAINFSANVEIAGSQMLYMILFNTWDGDNRGTHFLQPSEVGFDPTDPQKIPFVLDSFGDPLQFKLLYRTRPNDSLAVSHEFEKLSLEDVEIVVTSKNLK